MLVPILILSWNAFSQNVTEIKDTSHIVLTTDVARKVAVDLVMGDQAREELALTNAKVLELTNIIALQDSLGIMRENEISHLRKVVELQTLQTQQNLEDTEKLHKDLRKQSNLKTLFEVTTGVSTIALVISLIFGGR